MANRFFNRVYIIDSNTTAALPILGAGVTSWLDDASINSVHFWGADSTSKLELVYADNTTNSFCVLTSMGNDNPGAGSVSGVYFSTPQQTSELRVKTLTAGTAWIYLA